jgi:predicted transposase YbfD/YdcC
MHLGTEVSHYSSHGIREDNPQDETRYYVSCLLSCAKALLRSIRQRWSTENSWHWEGGVPLREDAHRYRVFNGVQILVTLRSLAINAPTPMGSGRSLRASHRWLMTSRACSG